MKKYQVGTLLGVIVFCIMPFVGCGKGAPISRMEVASETPSRIREKTSKPVRVSDAIAYVKSDGVYVMQYGKAPKRVYEGKEVYDVRFSPSGRHLIIDHQHMLDMENGSLRKTKGSTVTNPINDNAYIEGDDAIYEYEAKTGKRKRLVKKRMGSIYELLISPDGKALYYVLDCGEGPQKADGIYRFDLVNGRDEQLLTFDEYDELSGVIGMVDLIMSDDGESIYILGVIRYQLFARYDLKENKVYEIYSPSTSMDKEEEEGGKDEDYEHNYIPIWSSTALSLKGEQLMFLSPERVSAWDSGDDCIVLYDFETGNVRYLSPEYQEIRDIDISSQQSQIAYVAYDDFSGRDAIYVAEIDNPVPKELVGNIDKDKGLPRFLSDDQTVLFVRSNEDGGDSLWSVDVNGGNRKMIADDVAPVPFDVHHGK